ncbi:hypothetical protein N0V90_010144 [Kalmusia sp. IMI 367209]|nr:hypothetical protein N0V90_010144 [Kalmusia sp. IMI 367209]
MAPRKKTDEKPAAKATPNEAADTIITYLPAAAKILKDLHERGEIEGRVAGKKSPALHSSARSSRCAGKQIVYHVIQNPEDSFTPEHLAAMDTTTTELRASTTALQATAKSLRTQLSSLNSTLSTADLVASVQALEVEKSDVLIRLENLRAGKAKKVTKRERDEVEREWKKWTGVARKRQKISKDAWDMIEDFVEGDKERKAEIRERLGLDE